MIAKVVNDAEADGCRLGSIRPTKEDHKDAEDIARYCRNEMTDESRTKLIEKMQEWDLSGDRRLGLKEFFTAITVSLSEMDLDINVTPGAVQVMYDSMDKDGDGHLEFSEIESWLDAQMTRLRLALRRVRLFSNFDDDEIVKLQMAMVEQPFKKDEWVFHQGEEGNTFYVVLSGTCDVLRTDEGLEEHCLAKLGPGDFFGERSLLKNEPRFGGIVATDKNGLQTMSISRETFEKAMGAPLSSMVTSEYCLTRQRSTKTSVL